MDINVNLSGQRLRVSSEYKNLVAGTQRFIRFIFQLSSEWKNLQTFALFMQNGNGYRVYLDPHTYTAYLPSEITDGTFDMTLYGSGTDGQIVIGTTNYITFNVEKNIPVGEAIEPEFTPTEYEQLMELVQQYMSDTDTILGKIDLKANQTDLDALEAQFEDLTQSETVTTAINTAVDNRMEALRQSGYFEDMLSDFAVADGSLSRSKVDNSFEATLVKADTAMQPSVYDTHNKAEDIFDYTDDAVADVASNVTAITTEISGAYSGENASGTSVTYSNLGDAVRGALSNAKLYTNNAISNYVPYTTDIVDELPETGADRTIYLIPKESGNGYDKWWYIDDEDGGKVWDAFGGSATVIVEDTLPQTGDVDIDYILHANGEYSYYKYIDDNWRMIAGGGGQVLSDNSDGSIIVFGAGSPVEDYTIEDFADETYYLDTDDFALWGVVEETQEETDPEAEPVEPAEPTYVLGIIRNLVETPSQNKDYYIQDPRGNWVQFRYINSAFHMIGSDAYSRAETDTLISGVNSSISTTNSNLDALQTNVQGIASDVSTLTSVVNTMSNMVSNVTLSLDKKTLTVEYKDGNTSELELDTGLDIDRTAYNIDDDHKLHFYDSQGNELEGLAVEITGGGGGGGGTVSGNVSIARITSPNVQSIFGGDCIIEYNVLAQDSSGEEVAPGTGTLYVNNIAVLSGFTVYNSIEGAYNSINVGEYLSVGTNSIKISVSINTGGEANTVTTKTWSVNAINMYFTWDYIDSKINTSAVTDYYTPYGSLNKTIYTFLDVEPVGFNPKIVTALPDVTSEEFDPEEVVGINYFVGSGTNYTHYVYDEENEEFVEAPGRIINVNTTTRSGVQQTMSIPMQTHGSHTVVRYMVGDVNGDIISTDPQVHDMVFVVAGNNTPIIGVSFNTATMTQYNTVQIPIVVYDPASTTTTVVLEEDGTVVSTWTGVDKTVHYWNYSPTTFGTKTLTISCGDVSKTIVIEVEELSISEEEISGYDFRFKASEMATNTAVQEWANTYLPNGSSEEKTVSITFSDNFDWVNGGLHTEYDEDDHLRQYLCVRAGTTMTINYDLFGTDYDPKQYGKNFKFIFKAVNCRTYDANVLTCIDTGENNNGVGLVMTANEATLTTANNSVKTYYYKDSYIEFETNIHPTTEYRYLQVWMDGAPEVTKIYDTSDSMQQVTPVGITIGSPNCDVYVYMIKAYPLYLSNDNELSNFIMDAPNAYEMVDRYNRNDVMSDSGEVDYQKLANANPDLHVLLLDLNRMSTGKKDNVVAYTARHIYNAGGESQCFTVNNACITIQGTSSVGYLESAGNMDINFKYNRSFTSDNVSYNTSQIAFDDGTTSTSGFSMTENSIPVDYLNVKVNVASSENANNACNVDWYNTYQPWTSPARAKNPKARDTMEFVPGVVFIRDRSGNLFGDTTGYHMYGICDIGNSKKNTKVFHDTKNPIACCVEVSNNTSLPCLMSSKDYTWNADDEATIMELDPESGELKEQKVYEFRYVDDDSAKMAEDAWDRFVAFMYDHNPNLATNEPLPESVTFGTYTFKGYGTYDVSNYDSEDYSVVYLYGYGEPADFGYAASDYVSDTTEDATCYYYINYSNNQIYSSDGTDWTSEGTLTWTRSQNNVLGGTSIGTYAGTYTTDSYNYRMAYLLEHCEEYMVIDPVVYHFVFIESFLMTDNVAKNTFWSSDDLVHWEPSKDYDNDKMMSL